MIVRRPAVANQFYPGDPERLHYEIGRLLGAHLDTRSAVALVSPHAGYMYSGGVAGAAFSKVIMAQGVWEMPFGPVPVNRDLAKAILDLDPDVEDEPQAHTFEHSIEVQLPFLQYRQKDLSIVPICLSRIPYEACKRLGKAIAQAIEESQGKCLLVASTDMTHYESQDEANKKDRMAIERVLALDPEGLFDTVISNRISMCGFIPTVVALIASKAMGAEEAQLVTYATSGDITGDYRQVVGYASFIIS